MKRVMIGDKVGGMGDGEALDWKGIVERHAERVFRVAFRILGSVQDAEDASQEAFAEAFRLHEAGPIQSWTGLLVRLATLRSIDLLRCKRPAAELRESDRVSTVEPFEEVAATELADWLRQAMARLPDQQAAVFSMVHFQQISRDEAARVLGISVEAVSTGLYKARVRLMTQLSHLNRGTSK